MEPQAIKNVFLVQPIHPLPNMIMRSKVVMPRYGTPVLATLLRKRGYNSIVFVEEMHPINWELLLQADVLGIHALTCSVGTSKRLAEKFRFLKPGVPIIVGGTHSTYFPHSVLDFCDYVVRQEADETLIDLVDALRQGRDPETVPGITFKRDGSVVRTPDRPSVENFDTVVDLSTIYAWEKHFKVNKRFLHERRKRYPLMTVQTTRGCPFRCKFCPVATMFGPRYRKRDVESVIADVKDKAQYSRLVMFVDNNFTADPKNAARILERIIEEKIKATFTLFCRSDVYRHPELLALMKRAHVDTLFIGFESLNPDSLKEIDKRQGLEEIEKAIAVIRKQGIRVLASLMLGIDSDTKQSLQATRDFLMKHRIEEICVFAYWGITPNDGVPHVPPHRWIFKDWGYNNGNFVSHFPLHMKPSALQREIMRTYDEILSIRHALGDFLRLQVNKGIWRLVFRTSWRSIRPQVLDYLPYLEETEKGCYDEHEELVEDKVRARAELPWIVEQLR